MALRTSTVLREERALNPGGRAPNPWRVAGVFNSSTKGHEKPLLPRAKKRQADK